MYRLCCTSLLIAGTFLGALAGCNRGQQGQASAADLLVVPVARPVERPVADFVDYTGRTNAKVQVAVQARVTGFLIEMPFKEGAYVKEGDILFKIDPRPYKAQFDAADNQFKAAQNQVVAAKSQVMAAQSQLEANQAKLKYDEATNDRFKKLAKEKAGAVAERELDQYQALQEQSVANVALAKAGVATARANVDLAVSNLAFAESNLQLPKLNLEWTEVKSPIDGHISRYYLTKGNLVNQDSSQLTTVMSIDPMYVYFDMDEPTMLRTKQAMNAGKTRSYSDGNLPPFARYAGMVSAFSGLQRQGPLAGAAAFAPGKNDGAPVYIGLQGEEGFMGESGTPRHAGNINFVDNQVNAGTDSIQVRGTFENPKLADGSYLLVPGMFVRVRMPIGQEENQMLIIDRAIISEQGQKKIFVLVESKNADGSVKKDKDGNVIQKVEERIVVLGPLQDDGLRVISGKNFKKDDWVMFTSLQQVRPGMEVLADFRTMPELGKLSVPIAEKGKKNNKK